MCDSDNDINLWLDLEEGEISQEEFERRMYGIEYKETYWEDDSETIQMEDYLMQENECDKNIGTNELEQAFINKLYEDTKTDKILWTGLFCDKRGKNKLVDKCIDKIDKCDFNINPKNINNINISCKYCKYKDLCYMTQKDVEEIVLQEVETNEVDE